MRRLQRDHIEHEKENEEKKHQVLALGRLGWSLRPIQQATHIRRETASAWPPPKNFWKSSCGATSEPVRC
jgi:hypothetical protein